jgi:hypothetical protein
LISLDGTHCYAENNKMAASIFVAVGILTRFKLQVQSGGSFDIDYTVVGPGERIIMQGEKERQGDFVFTASESGEFRFCFNNEMSTFADKLVDFEIAVCTSQI